MTDLFLKVDNLDNNVLATETILFVVEGVAFTLDLCAMNLDLFRKDLARYTAVADRVGPAVITVNGEQLTPRRKVKAAQHSYPDTVTVADVALSSNEHDELLPPNKSWLHFNGQEWEGPGAKERARRGTAFRNAMRVWLRNNGYPDLGPRGKVPAKAVDLYWEHVKKVRADLRAQRT